MSYVWPPNFLLRRQKSLVCDSVCQPSKTIGSRERRPRFQKQLSVDQCRDFSVQRATNSDQLKNGHLAKNSWGCNNNNNINNNPSEASLRIFTATKNKSQNHGSEPTEQVQFRVEENEPSPSGKSRKKSEEKININIFLAQNIPELDLRSESECGLRKTKTGADQGNAKPMTNRLAIETRRCQFRLKNMSLSESRPRLMRAMSAPIRPYPPPEAEEKIPISNNQAQQSKRRLRRKKITPSEMNPFSLKGVQSYPVSKQHVSQQSFDCSSSAKAMSYRTLAKSAKPSRKATVQSRSKLATNGCEIVTLVSLLSPGASDSEKEDYSNGASDSPSGKNIPSLRKVGKSVSFQDDDSLGDDDPMIDLPSVLRRASLVPLAAKIRLNRPPTAPPGSIFHKSNTISENGMSGNNNKVAASGAGDSNENPISQLDQIGGEISKIPINILNATLPIRKSSIDILDSTTIYPEYVRSIKEKECWLLFQKMSNKGINVSYETILRGMLTPSEVRAVEKKQKEIFERQASIELEANATATAECDNTKK